jgi:tight adherence protein B
MILFLVIITAMAATGVAVGGGRILLVATFSLMLGAGIPILFFQVRANRMRKKMQDQFPVALDVFVRGLRAGHPIAAALDLLTVEMPDPIGSQFGIVVDEVTYGADLRDALSAMADRWDLEDMRMFVVSLSIQNETGGNLAEILENLSQVIRERASMMMKVRALSSEGRMTAAMLTGLPVVCFTLLFIGNPAFYLDVADDPAFLPGFIGLMVLYAIGFFTIRKMIDLKV